MSRKNLIISVLLTMSVILSTAVFCAGEKKKKPTHAEAADLHYRMGQDMFYKGDYLSALRELIQAVEMDKKNPDARFLLGTTYLYLQKYSEAEEHLKIAVEMRKSDINGFPQALNNLANVYLQTGRYDEAIETFDKCLNYIFYQPSFPQVYTNIGIAYQKKGDNAKAEENFNNAVRLEPGFCPAYLNLADMYGKAGRTDEALLAYQKILDRCPSSPISTRAKFYMGMQFSDMKRIKEACASFFAVMKEQPNTELAIKAGEYVRVLQCK